MKLTKIVSRDMALGIAFMPVKKEWVQLIPAALSVASSLIGGAKASKAAREAKKEQELGRARNNAWYLRRYNEDFADTAAGQNLLRRAKDYANSQWKKAEGAKAVGGGTDASAAMAKEAGNKMVGDTLANIAAQDQANKARVDAIHHQDENRETQMNMQRELTRSQNITNAAQNMSNAMMQVAGAIDGAKSQANTSTTSLTGGSNGSSSALKGDDAHLYGSIGIQAGDYTADEIDKLKREIGGL